ncbi:MAG: amidohydrolase [Eubacterium sp.]|nr:amidohydrolase [Eubacterium sp.]
MYIDFHIHAYAEKVAEKAVSVLSQCPEVENVYTDGTVRETRALLDRCGVDFGVVLPIATKPTQTAIINDWAIKHSHDNFICFGTVHPDNDNVEQELERIAEAGLRGIKLHPDYQECYMFDRRMQPIYRKCEQLGLMISLHMGYDPVSNRVRHAMPCDLAEVAEKYPSLTLIGAHMGGMSNWERVLHYVKGASNVYLDTAFCAEFITDGMMCALIDHMGEDRILLGSDLPWSLPTTQIEMIERLDISDEVKQKIYWKNAARLLKP